MNFVFFGVKKSGISVFLVSVENGAGVNKMTNMTYVKQLVAGSNISCLHRKYLSPGGIVDKCIF